MDILLTFKRTTMQHEYPSYPYQSRKSCTSNSSVLDSISVKYRKIQNWDTNPRRKIALRLWRPSYKHPLVQVALQNASMSIRRTHMLRKWIIAPQVMRSHLMANFPTWGKGTKNNLLHDWFQQGEIHGDFRTIRHLWLLLHSERRLSILVSESKIWWRIKYTLFSTKC